MKYPKPFQKIYDDLKVNPALTTNDKNILISASAGTGKTFILVNRLMRRLLDRDLELDEVVVMTFNETAAAELKAKTMQSLIENRDASDDEETKEYLNRQIAKLPSANISTIHAFSFEVIKKHGYAIDLDPAKVANVMSDADNTLFKELTIKEILKDKDLFSSVLSQTSYKPLDFDNLKKALEELYRLRSNYKDYDEWKNRVLKMHEDMTNNIFPECLVDILKRYYKGFVEGAINVIPEYLEFARENCQQPKSKGKTLSPDEYFALNEKHLKEILANFDSMSLDEIYSTKYIIESLWSMRKLDDEDEKKERKKEKKHFDDRFKIDKYITGNSESVINSQRIMKCASLSFPYVKELLELADRYNDYFESLKKENNLIAFDDMSKLAIEILKANDNDIAKQYQKRYKEIMVDEYQDSSYDQEKLIQLISRGNNVFRVGDLKQSIYGFRNAKPEIMQGLIDNQDPDKDLLVHQQVNFRSGKNILDFNNYIFNYAFNLIKEGTYDSKNEDLLLADKNIEIDKKIRFCYSKYGTNSNERRKYLIQLTAQDIKNRVEKSKGKLQYGDFMILVKRNVDKARFADVFSLYDVPYYASFDHGFFGDVAVSSVISIFKLLLDGRDKYNMVNVLRGPIYNISDEEIALFYYDKDAYGKDIRKDVYSLLKDIRKCNSINEMLERIYKENDWYLKNISIKQRDNLDELFQLIVEYQKEQSGLLNLVNYLDKQETADKSEATSTSSQDDVVQVMTIHQAKGLSRKIVYVLDLNNTLKDDKEPILFSEKLGLAMHYVYEEYNVRVPSQYHALLKKAKQQEEYEQELRVFYVALTRAEEELNIVHFNGEEIEFNNIEEKDLIYGSIFSKTIYDLVLTIINNKPNKDILKNIKIVELEAKEDEEFISDKNNDQEIKLYPTSEKVDDIQIEEDEDDGNAHQENHDFIYPLNYNQPDGAGRGSIMHRAIELLGIKDITSKDVDNLDLPIKEDDKQKILNFYQNSFTKSLINNENHHEYPYIRIVNNNAKNNVIDLLSIADKDVYIIDFKSDKNLNEKQLVEKYYKQLNIYYSVVSNIDDYKNKNIVVYIYSFDLDKYVEVVMNNG